MKSAIEQAGMSGYVQGLWKVLESGRCDETGFVDGFLIGAECFSDDREVKEELLFLKGFKFLRESIR